MRICLVAFFLALTCGCSRPSPSAGPGSLSTTSESAPHAPAPAQERSYGFDADAGGRLPTGFSTVHDPADGLWRVQAVPVAASIPHVLAWVAKGSGEGRVLVLDAAREKIDLAVQVRPAGDGPAGQAGIVLGWQGGGRYWAVSWDPAARRCRIESVSGDTRNLLAEATLAPVGGAGTGWDLLTVSCRNDTISCTVNGAPCGAARDKTFLRGRLGLFARGGSFLFDDFSIKPR